MATQRWYNPLIAGILRSPLHRVLSGSVLLLTYTGRRSGATFTMPLNYVRDGDSLLLLSPRGHAWWRNLRAASPVEVLVHGRQYRGLGRALDGEETLGERGPRALLRRAARGSAAPDNRLLRRVAVAYVVVRIADLRLCTKQEG